MTCLLGPRRADGEPDLEALTSGHRFLVVSGLTGSAKTSVLRTLIQRGAQALDLEALAAHRGSAFGKVPGTAQPTAAEFRRSIARYLRAFDPTRPIWIEEKGDYLGSLAVPDAVRARLLGAAVVRLHRERVLRVRHLVEQYRHLSRSRLHRCLEQLRSRLDPRDVTVAHARVHAGDLSEAVGIVLPYYDATYHAPEPGRVVYNATIEATCDALAEPLLRVEREH